MAAPFFFHSEAFIFRNGENDILSFSIENGSKIYFSIKDAVAVSLPDAPFGGLVFETSPDLESEGQKWSQVEGAIKSRGVRQLIIKTWPECYAPKLWNVQDNYLRTAGFDILHKEMNQHFDIGKDGFHKNLAKDKKYRLGQVSKNNLVFRRSGPEDLVAAYELFVAVRAEKGYPVTMTFEALQASFEQFPDHYQLYTLWEGDFMAAATVTIRVNHRVWYNFYHGDALEYRPASPLLLLIRHLHELAMAEGVEILDLGISSDQGMINPGLFDWKERLGCRESFKLIYQKNL